MCNDLTCFVFFCKKTLQLNEKHYDNLFPWSYNYHKYVNDKLNKHTPSYLIMYHKYLSTSDENKYYKLDEINDELKINLQMCHENIIVSNIELFEHMNKLEFIKNEYIKFEIYFAEGISRYYYPFFRIIV